MDVEKITKGFEDAISTIHAWHGDIVWDIYFTASPEMKRIREAQAEAQRLAETFPKVTEALSAIEREISGRFGSDDDMTPDTRRVVLQAREALRALKGETNG